MAGRWHMGEGVQGAAHRVESTGFNRAQHTPVQDSRFSTQMQKQLLKKRHAIEISQTRCKVSHHCQNVLDIELEGQQLLV